MSRIWIINQFANTPELPGHTRQYEIGRGLVKLGWEVEVFSSDFNLSKRSFSKLRGVQLELTEKHEGMRWTWLRVFPYKINNWRRYVNMATFSLHLFFKLFFLAIFSKLRGEDPDVVFASSPQLPAAFVSLCLAILFRKHFVVEIRDLWPQALIDMGNTSNKSWIVRLLSCIENVIYKNAEFVTVLSQGCVEYVRDRGAEKVFWLPNGADLEEFKALALPDENNGFTQDRPMKILYAGAHGSANNLSNVIRAASLVEHLNIRFVFIGDGPEKNSLVNQARFLTNIEFLEPLPKVEMPSIMATSDVVLLSLGDIPLFRYGVSPNKLYDAYAVGRPVLTTVEGFINNEVKDNNLGGTTPPEDSRLLANEIERLFYLPRKERELMGKRARKLAETVYSRNLIISKYHRLLTELLID